MYHFKCSIKNKSYVIVFALIALVVARTPEIHPITSLLEGRIIGGSGTAIDNLPYQVSVQYKGTHICGGSIISSTRVLTAASCTNQTFAGFLSVRAGTSYHDFKGTIVSVENICTHPEYVPYTHDNDVSVLRLSHFLTFSKTIQPISLVDPGNFVNSCFLATVSGWGIASQGTTITQLKLKKVDVSKVSQEDCKQAYGPTAITKSMTCFGWTKGGRGFCNGDHGGPLAIGRIQIGIASWGYGCAQEIQPDIYVDLSKAIIRNHINSC